MSNPPNILVIEDDESISEVIRLHLSGEGYEVATAANGHLGLTQATTRSFSVIILDLQLPGLGGIDLCRQLREAGIRTPVIMLTSRSGEIDKVIGLEIGADDYMTKPFSVYELTARVRARLRGATQHSATRVESAPEVGGCLTFGDLVIDQVRRRVTLSGREFDLTLREFELLLLLASNPGVPISHQQILEEIWGVSGECYIEAISTTIHRLRKKIERVAKQPQYILTVHGYGYRFAEGASGGADTSVSDEEPV